MGNDLNVLVAFAACLWPIEVIRWLLWVQALVGDEWDFNPPSCPAHSRVLAGFRVLG